MRAFAPSSRSGKPSRPEAAVHGSPRQGSENTVEAEIGEIVSLPKEYRCRFSGKSDRTAAEGLRGALIFTEADSCQPRGNEFYHFELIGMAVLGDITNAAPWHRYRVHNFPSIDTVEVKLDAGATVLLPLSMQAILTIDRRAKRITVRESFIEELLS